MQRDKRQIDPSIFNNPDIDELSEKVLDIPIKKSKEIQSILKLRAEQQKILQKTNLKKSRNSSSTNRSQSFASFPKHESHPQSNDVYIMECIIRSLGFRKLAIDDIAQIFAIQPEVVEEIDKYRRLKEFEAGDDDVKNPKLEIMRNNIIARVEKSVRNASVLIGVDKTLTDSFSSLKKPKQSIFSSLNPSQLTQKPLPQKPLEFSLYSDLNTISEALSRPQEDTNLFEYQRLLRSCPPHRLDNKTIAIVDILKKRPNLVQKDIIKVLAEEYGIAGMTQTTVSRYIRKIYDMKKHVDVILQAQKDGFIVL